MIAVTDEGPFSRAITSDLEDEVRVVDTPWRVRELNPDFLIHTYEVGYYSRNRAEIWNVNVWRVLNMARAANSVGATNIFISSFMIFDGNKGMYTENSPPSPLNYYGVSKLAGEAAVAALGNYLILRLGLLYGSQIHSILSGMLRNMTIGRRTLCPQGFYVSPIGVKSLSKIISELVKARIKGIFNVATQRIDLYEFCRKLGELFGAEPSPVHVRKRDFSLDTWLLGTLGIKVSVNYDIKTTFGADD
ncbi:dTDP-4-dehydrorhamnose reductase [Sulfodiicoccus acidiphilus]|nr:sugar nucleotide-binding protein [Sulfodiicoccus acidiphilus]BBD72393.1 dTDP-4-dehydrorhamnose reductase [Sulfodiicoccus acidiphilus]